jgi:hypothetical protein
MRTDLVLRNAKSAPICRERAKGYREQLDAIDLDNENLDLVKINQQLLSSYKSMREEISSKIPII